MTPLNKFLRLIAIIQGWSTDIKVGIFEFSNSHHFSINTSLHPLQSRMGQANCLVVKFLQVLLFYWLLIVEYQFLCVSGQGVIVQPVLQVRRSMSSEIFHRWSGRSIFVQWHSAKRRLAVTRSCQLRRSCCHLRMRQANIKVNLNIRLLCIAELIKTDEYHFQGKRQEVKPFHTCCRRRGFPNNVTRQRKEKRRWQ